MYGAQLAANRFGQANGAYAFDGDDYIDTGVQLNVMATPISVSLWAHIADSSTNRTYLFGHQGPVLSAYDEYHMYVNATSTAWSTTCVFTIACSHPTTSGNSATCRIERAGRSGGEDVAEGETGAGDFDYTAEGDGVVVAADDLVHQGLAVAVA